jgi:DNA-binding PadR family transcriptional regulator
VLLALASGHSHGYAVMTFVDQLSEFVSESGANDPSAPHDARRRYYELTPQGAAAVRKEAELLARLVAAADTAGLLGASRRTA